MPQPHDEDELDDRELPDESDLGDEFDATEPCPFCGKDVHEDADLCPHCHNFLSQDPPARRPFVLWIGLILLVIALVVTFILSS